MKRCMIELVGTFYLTMAISLTGNPIAIGLMLMAIICVGGRLSGGHFNPAISLAAFLQKRLDMSQLIKYWISQTIGAFLALCLFMMFTNNVFAPEIIPGSSVFATVAMEGLLTKLFCWVFLTMLMLERTSTTSFVGIVMGLTLMSIVFVGGLFNPAVAAGSLVCSLLKDGSLGDFYTVLVYIVGPLLGGVMASYAFNFFNREQQ